MFKMIVSGKPTNFEFVDKSVSETLGAAFTLTEKGWNGTETFERNWVVWVPNHKMKWAEKMTRKSEYTVIVEADWVNCVGGNVWSCRLSEISNP